MASCYVFELAGYKATVRSGLAVLPWPQQMEALFGEGDHFITQYGFVATPRRQWNSEVFFWGRYVLTMQVDVEVDYSNHRINKALSEPIFYLNEISKAVPVEGGGVSAFHLDAWTLDKAKWERLVAAKGDWSALGILVKKDDPAPNFDLYVKALRGPRVKVK